MTSKVLVLVLVLKQHTKRRTKVSSFLYSIIERVFPFPPKRKKRKKIREKKVCTCRLGFMVSTKPKEKKNERKKKGDINLHCLFAYTL